MTKKLSKRAQRRITSRDAVRAQSPNVTYMPPKPTGQLSGKIWDEKRWETEPKVESSKIITKLKGSVKSATTPSG